MKKIRFLVATSLIAGGSTFVGQSVMADDDDERQRPNPITRMMSLDKNEDGKISKDEAPERLASMFARADKNEDGFLNEEEIRQAFASRVTDREAERGDGERGPQFGDRDGMRRRGPLDEDGRPERGPRDGDRQRGGREEGMERDRDRPAGPPQSVLMSVIDRNRDGKISEQEILNAVKAIKSLDKNEDGIIDADELRPPRRGPGDLGAGDRGPEGRRDGDRGPEGGPGFREGFRERMRERAGDRGPGGGPPSPEGFVKMMLERMDKNDDGELSGDEIPERMAERLKQIDKNGDGAVDKKELEAMAEQVRRGRGPGAAGDRPGPGFRERGRRGAEDAGDRDRSERPVEDKS